MKGSHEPIEKKSSAKETVFKAQVQRHCHLFSQYHRLSRSDLIICIFISIELLALALLLQVILCIYANVQSTVVHRYQLDTKILR